MSAPTLEQLRALREMLNNAILAQEEATVALHGVQGRYGADRHPLHELLDDVNRMIGELS